MKVYKFSMLPKYVTKLFINHLPIVVSASGVVSIFFKVCFMAMLIVSIGSNTTRVSSSVVISSESMDCIWNHE